jgi:hypothetical protein
MIKNVEGLKKTRHVHAEAVLNTYTCLPDEDMKQAYQNCLDRIRA